MRNTNKKAYEKSWEHRIQKVALIQVEHFDNASKYIIELESRVARLSKKLKVKQKSVKDLRFCLHQEMGFD